MSIDQILYLVGSMALALVGYIGRTYMQRLDTTQDQVDTLKKLVDTKINDGQARQLLADKIDPLKESIEAIEIKLDKMYYLMLSNNK